MKTCAIVGLILSIVSLFIMPYLFGAAAIVLGAIAGCNGYIRGWVALGIGFVSISGILLMDALVLSPM